MKDIFNNDKTLIIFALLIIAVDAMYSFGFGGKEIVGNIVSGLLGVVVGSRLGN